MVITLNRTPHGRTVKGLRRLVGALRRKFEASDAILFLYFAAFTRQYFWGVGSQFVAWGLAFAAASVVWCIYVSTKETADEDATRWFWTLVVLPLVFFYALRVPFPDVSFDVLNYRLFSAERSLRGTLFAPGDFFPTPAPYNPAPDTLTSFARLALGYRLGTIFNLFALVWAGLIVDKILRPFVARAWARAACVLAVVLAEHLLFEVNTYMVDLLALPLLLEATRLTLRADEAENRRATYVRVALLLGASAALKLTSATAILPLTLVCAYKALVGARRLAPKELASTVALAFVAFVAPLVPFGVYLYRLTGNPLFPLANGVFKSPYWPTGGGWDARWGPSGTWETLAWPVLIWFEPARHSELALYSGRLSIGFAAALVGLALAWRDERTRTLSIVLLAGCLLWSAGGMGYSRYGLYFEVLSGVVVVAVASVLLRGASRAWLSWRTTVACLLCAALVGQAALACSYALRAEWSGRAPAFERWAAYKTEARFLLRDRSLKRFLADDARAFFDAVPVWVESGAKTNGMEVMLNGRAPVISVSHPEYFATREARRQFVRRVDEAVGAEANKTAGVGADEAAGVKMFSLCFPEDLSAAKEAIAARGLEVVGASPIQIPYFSPRHVIGMMLLEVSRPREPDARARFETSWMESAFPDSDYRAEISTTGAPATMRAGERVALRFRVRNLGGSTWPARVNTRGMFQVNLGDRWLDADGERVVNDLDSRAALPADLPPGGEVELALNVNAPQAPGEYVLEIDLVHEGVTFFFEKGSRTLRLRVRVEP
jgi:hypothetical protein